MRRLTLALVEMDKRGAMEALDDMKREGGKREKEGREGAGDLSLVSLEE